MNVEHRKSRGLCGRARAGSHNPPSFLTNDVLITQRMELPIPITVGPPQANPDAQEDIDERL